MEEYNRSSKNINMNITTVSTKDYKKIKNLFKRNYLEIIPFKRWKNLWEKNPRLKNKKIKYTKGWVIKKNQRIVGHIGNFPMEYFFNKKSYYCSAIYGWVVDKQYRSQSITLLKKCFSQSNADFFLGAANNQKANKIMNMFNAKEVPSKSLNYSLIIALNLKNIINFFLKNKYFPLKNQFLSFFSQILLFIFGKKIDYWKYKFSDKNIVQCNEINNTFNILWPKIKNSQKNVFLFRRDKKWLKWHLDHLIKNKKAWIYFNIKNKKINGYSICVEKKNSKTGIRSALLIDLMTFNQPNKTSKDLIGSNIAEAKRRNCDIFEFRGFCNTKIAYMNFFKPFKKNLLNNPFCYKSNISKINIMLSKSKNWCLSYLDGDAIIDQ